MDRLEKNLKALFAECETIPECHDLHVKILELLNEADSNRRNEIIEKGE